MTGQRAFVLDGLASTAADVARLTRHLDAAGPARPHESTARSAVAATLAHLLAVEQRVVDNLRLVADHDHALLVDEHADPADAPLDGSALGHLVAAFDAARQETLRLLDALPPGGWTRPVRHPALGTVRVIVLARRLLDHDLTHLGRLADQSRSALADRGRARVRG